MTKRYYECHITMLGDPEILRPMVENIRWKFSAIDGDPVLGEGLKCYATMFYNEKIDEKVVLSLLLGNSEALKSMGAHVLRDKVELVIYDSKIGKVNVCNGACPECHIDDYEERDNPDMDPDRNPFLGENQ